jgi:intraflagellar transport protein 172
MSGIQLKHLRTIIPSGDSIAKITAIAWSPNNTRMAAISSNKMVVLYDENGESKDKFNTKPGESGVSRV